MSTTVYTGAFVDTKPTFLRLTAEPYRLITAVSNDGSALTVIGGSERSATAADCTNYSNGIITGSYALGKLSPLTSTVSVTTTPYTYTITYHRYAGPTSTATSNETVQYGVTFSFRSTSSSGNKFIGWAVGSENSNIIIPSTTTTGVLYESTDITTTPASITIPTMGGSPSTTLHLYARWRPCASVAIGVTVTDNSPITYNITLANS